jgi:circadian clock protein KaiA
MLEQLSICGFIHTPELEKTLHDLLIEEKYQWRCFNCANEFMEYIARQQQAIDCLICQNDRSLLPVANRLHEQGINLPTLILPDAKTLNFTSSPSSSVQISYLFHPAEIHLELAYLENIHSEIAKAIAQFISLPMSARKATSTNRNETDRPYELSEKLKARLGYLGVYYKRNPQYFLRNLTQTDQDKLIDELRAEYRHIVLRYFSDDRQINEKIDNFVTRAFLADIAVPKIVELHMDLMEDFANHLKLEGRSDEVLLDYRLTLIDVIAHLCEMYRRSIPREI